MEITIRPSDIVLRGPVPLTGTFEHVEAEQMAGMLVGTMQASGDEWTEVPPKAIGEWMKTLQDEDRIPHWMRNPFFNPDADDLIDRGFAEWVGPASEERSRPIRFTRKGLEALQGSLWVRR